MEAERENYDFAEDIISQTEAEGLSALQRDFLESYAAAKDTMEVKDWLPLELKRQMPERSDSEIGEMSVEILESLELAETVSASQQQAVEQGRSKESWLASTLLRSTSQMSTLESAHYLYTLDNAVRSANESMRDTVTTRAGVPNQNPNLDGFIAEQYHVNTYNMKAQAVGGELHAEVLKPKPGEVYGKNSVDIVLKDASGKVVHRYQAKYGATAEDTIRYIKEGNYNNQRLLVPEDQVEAVQKAFPNKTVTSTIGEGEVTSSALSKEQAKELQEKAQKTGFLDADWNEYKTKDIALGIGQQAGYACLQGAAVGAGMAIATQVWNGEPIDGEEVISAALASGADFGVKAAAAGALKTASEKGILTVIPKGTPGATFANIAFVAVENVKILRKVATGELTPHEGVDRMQQTTGACVAGLAASTKGAGIGASIGTVLGPVGIAVGGFIGGTVGYMAGSTIGQAVVKGAQKVRDKAVEVIKSVGNTVASGIKSFVSGFAGLFSW